MKFKKSIFMRNFFKKTTITFFMVLLITGIGILNGNTLAKAQSTTYYVSTSGSDFNPGTIDQPLRTINAGVKLLTPGDTLYIRGGTYQEEVNINGYNGSANNYYTIKNYNNEKVVMIGGDSISSSPYDHGFEFQNSSFWNIDGIEFSTYQGAGVWLNGVNNSSVDHNFNLTNLKAHDIEYSKASTAGAEGILGNGNVYNCDVKGCQIYNIGLIKDNHNDHGIYIGYGAHDWTIEANKIHDVTGSCIQLWGAPSGGKNCNIYNNILYNSHRQGLILGYYATDNKVYNNTFYNNYECDVYIIDNSYNNTLRNNIFGSFGSIITVEIANSSYFNNSFDYNCYWKTDGNIGTGGLTYSYVRSRGEEAHGVYGNPQFVNANGGNFRVYGYSNTTGVGSNDNNVPTYDFSGTLREAPYQDMGAYDYDLLFDNFEGLANNTYDTQGGLWEKVQDGGTAYEQYGQSSTGMKSLTGECSWSNYCVESDVKMVSGTNGDYNVGLIARASSDMKNYYVAVLGNNSVALYKVVNGNWTTLGWQSKINPTLTWHHLALTCNGSSLSVSVNGDTIISATDSSISSGRVGMYTNYASRWDNFKVSPRY